MQQENWERMATAEKALIDWQCQQRISRATNSRHRQVLDFSAGDLVYIWRKQLTGQDAGQNKQGSGRFVGPARILATEMKRDDQGELQRGSSIWLVRGRRLIKCCAEQLRHATDKEHIIHDLHQPDQQPWTFPKVAEELGGTEFDDYTEALTEMEWERAKDPDSEWQPIHLFRMKRTPTVADMRPAQVPRTSPGPYDISNQDRNNAAATPRRAERSRSPPSELRAGPSSGFQAAPHWSDHVQDSFFVEEASQSKTIWKKEGAAVEVAIEFPGSRSSAERALQDLPAFFTAAMKRKSVEVCERKLTSEQLKEFRSAKAVEVSNFLAAKAFEALPPEYRADKTQAVRMRWILTWKIREDGTQKAKARAVLLGYQDPLYEHRATASPTTTRQTRQLQLQIAAGLNWQTRKGDVSGAFLQGREYPGELLCIPCEEICLAMGLPPNSVTRVKRACYGLVDAPLEWYRSICDFFGRIGLRRCWADPCSWILVKENQLHGIISGHVDDFLFSGSDEDPVWIKTIEQIKQQYRWGDWEQDRFTQCGVQVERDQKGGYALSQERYVEGIKHINIRAHRRKERHAETDDFEKSQLRALLGAISWHAQQVAPHFSAEVGLMLSEVNKSCVDTLMRANHLLDQVKGMKDHKLLIHSIPVEEIGLFAWADAASQNRIDGGSTQGICIGAASKRLLQGQCTEVSLIAWHSSKISRVCSSPGASEAVAAVNGEDLLFFARFQLSELLGYPVNIRNVHETVNHISGCVITDSRNVYDKLSGDVVVAKGAERRTDIDLMRLKESQVINEVILRWVNSDAQLGNGLTKAKERRQFHMFYRMRQCWRIVEDDTMSSARKRKQKGQQPLEQNIHPPCTQTHCDHGINDLGIDSVVPTAVAAQ